MILGPAVAHAVSPSAGAGVGFGLFIAGTIISVFLARTPNTAAARFWNRNTFLARFWFLAFYSGNQLRRDLNLIVGTGKNWTIPTFWPFLLRYISAPVLALIYSFSYPAFYQLRNDPMHIAGFTLAHLCLVLVVLGVMIPRYFDVFIPPNRRDDGKFASIANEPLLALDAHVSDSDKTLEEGQMDVDRARKESQEIPAVK